MKAEELEKFTKWINDGRQYFLFVHPKDKRNVLKFIFRYDVEVIKWEQMERGKYLLLDKKDILSGVEKQKEGQSG